MVLVVKNLLPKQETWDASSIPGLGSSPGGGHGNPLSIPAWGIPWTKEPCGLESRGLQRVRHHWSDEAHTQEQWGWTLAPNTITPGMPDKRDKIRLNPQHADRPSHDPQLELILSPHPSSPPCSWRGRFDMKRSIVSRFIYTLNAIPIICQQILFPPGTKQGITFIWKNK